MAAPFFSAIATSSQHYLTSDLPQFSMASGFTMSAWFRATSLGSLDRILLKQNQSTWTSPEYDTVMMLNSSSNLSGGELGTQFIASGGDDYPSGEWVHAGVTINSANDTISFYVRGKLIGSGSRSTNLGSDSGPWVLGGNTSNQRFRGHVWDVRIALTERPLSWFEKSYVRGLRFFASS